MVEFTDAELKEIVSTLEGRKALASGIKQIVETDFAADNRIALLVATEEGVSKLNTFLDEVAAPATASMKKIENDYSNGGKFLFNQMDRDRATLNSVKDVKGALKTLKADREYGHLLGQLKNKGMTSETLNEYKELCEIAAGSDPLDSLGYLPPRGELFCAKLAKINTPGR